jgi:uncharacterized protein
MSENVDVLRRGYEAFNTGDAETLAGVFASDVRWQSTDDERVPGGGTFDSRDAALAALGQSVQAFESFVSRPDEFHEDGDTVVVVGRSEGRTTGGNAVEVPFIHVWSMRDGKIERGRLVTDTAVVLDALG